MREIFGTLPDGTDVQRLVLRGGGLTAAFLTYGALVQDLRLDGHDAPLVLGFPKFSPYPTHSPHFGAIAGRCANRIRDGHLKLDGQEYQLDRNFQGRHLLHGGADGTGKRLWRIVEHGDNYVTFAITLEDGHMGFPGSLTARATYSLYDTGILDIAMTAETDAPTLCNLAHHSYFNLDGGESISNHLLWIDAERYLPVDDALIPTGEIRSVAGSGFNFREPTPIAQAHPVDHNFCLSRQRVPLRPVARFHSPKSGVTMECLTTEPGLQIYDGAKIAIDPPGLHGKPMGAFAGLAMEPQVWPNANHHAGFPSAELRPGEIYKQQTQYVFSKQRT